MSRNPRNKTGLATLIAALLLVTTGGAFSKESDRSQPMSISASISNGNFSDDGSMTLTGDVVITQGSLEVYADKGTIHRQSGQISHAVFTGKQARMKQINDDGTPIDATADQIDYDVASNIITLTGDYKITSPRGTNSGQKMVYNTVTGNMQSGGDGSRVHTVIQPKPQPGADTPNASGTQ